MITSLLSDSCRETSRCYKELVGGRRMSCRSLARSCCCRRLSLADPVGAAAGNVPDLLLAGQDSLLLTVSSLSFNYLILGAAADHDSVMLLLVTSPNLQLIESGAALSNP